MNYQDPLVQEKLKLRIKTLVFGRKVAKDSDFDKGKFRQVIEFFRDGKDSMTIHKVLFATFTYIVTGNIYLGEHSLKPHVMEISYNQETSQLCVRFTYNGIHLPLMSLDSGKIVSLAPKNDDWETAYNLFVDFLRHELCQKIYDEIVSAKLISELDFFPSKSEIFGNDKKKLAILKQMKGDLEKIISDVESNHQSTSTDSLFLKFLSDGYKIHNSFVIRT